MPFASMKNATDSNGKIKEGYKKITDKNGKIKYLSNVPVKRKPKDSKASKASKVSKASKASKKTIVIGKGTIHSREIVVDESDELEVNI